MANKVHLGQALGLQLMNGDAVTGPQPMLGSPRGYSTLSGCIPMCRVYTLRCGRKYRQQQRQIPVMYEFRGSITIVICRH